MRHINLRWH